MFRIRRSRKRKIWISMFFVSMGVGTFMAGKSWGDALTGQRYEKILATQTARLENAGRLVFITTREIKAGEAFGTENTKQCYLLSEQAEEGLVHEVTGMVACADLMPGIILQTALCTGAELSETERECVLEGILRTELFTDGSVVDVRIRYPNGENYCVLGKKVLQREEGTGESCKFILTETEQLLMSAAQYDAEVYTGTVLYAVSYVEERLQREADSRYLPPEQVLQQLQQLTENIESSENRAELRKALEERLSENQKQREELPF